jgi:hypothetical protein
MISQVAYLSSSVRELFAMMLTVVLLPMTLPLMIALNGVGERYAIAVKGKGGTHGYGPPHLQKALCLLRHLANMNITDTGLVSEHNAVCALVSILDKLSDPEESCEALRFCKSGPCYLKEGEPEANRQAKIMFRFEFVFHAPDNSHLPIDINKAVLRMLKFLGASARWAPAPPAKQERKLRYTMKSMFA